MAAPVLHRVIHGTTSPTPFQRSLLTTRPALLRSHRRHRVLHADYPAVIPEEGEDATVLGTLVTGLTDGDIWRLDIFEGDEYERRKVEVEVLNDVEGGIDEAAKKDQSSPTSGAKREKVAAQTYVWIAGVDRLEKREWDFEEFRKEKMGGWVGTENQDATDGDGKTSAVREDIKEVDEAVKAKGDPTGGRGIGGWIQEELKRVSEPSTPGSGRS